MERRTSSQEPNGPTVGQIAAFNEACVLLKDPSDHEQWGRFAKAASQMQRAGWNDAQIIEGLWNVRPDVRPADRTPEEVVMELKGLESAGHGNRNPFPLGQLTDELEFHTSIIQKSALSGKQIVVTGRVPHVDNLPPDVPRASRRRPFFLDPGHLFQAQIKRP